MAAGDSEALAGIFEELRQSIYLLAYSLLHNHQQAEDVVQETFVKLMDSAASYQPGGSAAAWVLRIAQHTAIDLMRRESRLQPLVDEIPYSDTALDETDAGIDFLKATKGLNLRDRSIVIYKVFSGLSHAEIGAAVGMSEGAVRVRYHRIMQRLQAFYRQRG